MRLAIGALALAAAVLAAPAASASAGRPAGGPPAPSAQPSAPSTQPPSAALQRLHFGVRLVDVPVDEASNPRALRYIIDVLPTETAIKRRIMIINFEPRTAHFTVYAGAARISNGLFIGAAGHAASELTGWITVQHPSVTLGPGQSVMDLVTIRVPRGATRGEHYGVIWAQQAPTIRPGSQVRVMIVGRVGIRVYLAVGRGGVQPTKFSITSLTGQRLPSGQHLVAHVRNTGGRAVDLTGQARLAGGPGGLGAGPFTVQRMVTLAPGQAGNVVFALPAGLPSGPWMASVTLVSGVNTATARASIMFGVQLTSGSWASPLTLAWGGGLLLGAAVIGATAITRLRRPRPTGAA